MHVLHLPRLHALRATLVVVLAILVAVAAYAAGAELLVAGHAPPVTTQPPADPAQLTPAPILLPQAPPAG